MGTWWLGSWTRAQSGPSKGIWPGLLLRPEAELPGVPPPGVSPTVFLLLRRTARHWTLLILLVHFSLSDI